MTDSIAANAKSDAELDILRSELREARARLEEYERRDTMPPSERQTGAQGALLEMAAAVANATDTIDSCVTRISKEMQETRKTVDEIPDRVRECVKDAYAEHEARVEALESEVRNIKQWQTDRELACQGCPRLHNASGM